MTKGNQLPAQQQPQTQQQHSMQYNIRNDLLSGDIGNIDITKETPINTTNNNNFIQHQQFQNYNNMYMNQQTTNVPFNNNYNNYNIQSTLQHKNKPVPIKQDKRTYSLNQKSITNFFKGKNHSGFGFGINKSKKHNHRDGSNVGGDDDDDDGDVFIDDHNSSTLTFHDIQKYGFKNGDKLNVTEDTTPLIPTLVTKQTSNMSNTEYRKFLNTQKKNVLNALNNQTKLSSPTSSIDTQNMTIDKMGGFSNNQSQPRAMSLQNGFNGGNPYPMQQQQQFRKPNGMVYNGFSRSNTSIPNSGGPRANSLMTGGMQPIRYFDQQQREQQQPQGNNMGYPRTMSLTNNPQQAQIRGNGFNNPYRQQQFVNNAPNPSNMNQQIQPQYRTMSLQQRPTMNTQQFINNANTNSLQQSQVQPSLQQQPLQQQQPSQQSVQGQVPEQRQSQHQLQQQGQISVVDSSINSNTNPPNNITNSNILNVNNNGDNLNREITVNTSQPKNNEINTTSIGANCQNTTTISKREGEQRNEQNLQINSNVNKPKLNIIKLSKPKQEELLQKENITNDSVRKIDHISINDNAEQKNSTTQEPDLRPSSLLQEGLNSLNLNDNNTRDSTITQVSSFSVSPIKQQESHNQSIYRLANGTDSKAFVTAEEFLPLNHDNNANHNLVGETNQPTEKLNRNSGMVSAIAIAPASKRISIYKNSSSSASSASSTVSKKSNDTGEKIQHKSPLTVTATKTDSQTNHNDQLSITESDNADIDVTFLHKHSPRTPTQRTTKQQSKDEEKNSDNFSFDNTLFSPYKDITQTAPKILYIPKEQMSLLNENKRLMKELTLLSTELAESIKRETLLEDKIQNMKQSNEFSNQTQRNSTISTSSISYTDFETELRRKSSKIVELIQALNEERMKRFIAEEQLLLKENNAGPSWLDLIKKINELENKLQSKENAINDLKSALSNL